MSITRHMAELLLAEHKYQPIRGEVLLLGRQQVFMTPDEAQALIDKLGLPRSPGAFVEYDKMPNPHPKKLISDASFFSLFSDAVVQACDVSDYEGAEIIFNLSEQVPPSLLSRFDFIYNGSVFDNVFDPAACIRNVSKMLKPHGRILSYEGAAHAFPAYLKFSPDWFVDYYALNDFADCQAYIVTYGDVHRDPWEVYQFDAFTPEGHVTWPMRLPAEAMIVAIAQNSPNATLQRTPLQGNYRSEEHGPYRAAFERFKRSPRRDAIRGLFPPTQTVAPSRTKRSLLSALLGKPQEAPKRTIAAGHTLLGSLGSPKFED